MSLVNKTLRGTAWAYAAVMGSRLITFGVTAVLVRLLTPSDFGLLGLALIVMGVFEATQSLGVNDALIYQSDKVDEAANTVFLFNIGIGAVLSALIAGLAVWIGPSLDRVSLLAALLGEANLDDIQRAIALLPIMGTCFFISSLGQTHEALLRKEMEFRARFWPDMISAVIRGAVSIVLALLGYGVMSLVAGLVVGCVVRTISNWLVMPWRPKFRYYPEAARQVWRYAAGITIFNTVSTSLDKIDETVIGSLLGSASLGFYTQAGRIPELLVLYFNLVVTRVLFPAFSKMKDDLEALGQGFLLATRYMTMVAMPLSLGVVLIAPDFVAIYFGLPKWKPAIELLQVLSLTTLWVTMAWNAGDVYKALGRPGLLTQLTLIEMAVNLPLLLGGAYLDRNQVLSDHPALFATAGSSVGYLFGTLIRLAVVSRLLKISYVKIWREFVPSTVAGVAMVVGVLALRILVVGGLPPLPLLMISTAVGAAIYLGVLWLVGRKDIQVAVEALRGAVRGGDSEGGELPLNQSGMQAATPADGD